MQERESLHFYTNTAFILFGNNAGNMKKGGTTQREPTYMEKITSVPRNLKPDQKMLNSCSSQIHFIYSFSQRFYHTTLKLLLNMLSLKYVVYINYF